MTNPNPLALPAPAAVLPAGEIDDNPSKDLRASLMILTVFGALFGAWAKFAPLDAAAEAAGHISVFGHSQVVAHREGGVVSKEIGRAHV